MMNTDMYMIHACPDRMWYVNKYLIPSLIEQGIDKYKIILWYDMLKKGNLKSCIDSFASFRHEGNTWHLQDDVIISRDFAVKTIYTDYGDNVVCGMATDIEEERDRPSGEVMSKNMWYSFQCIRIPNTYAIDFSNWVKDNILNSNIGEYKFFARQNKFDDTFFRIYMEKVHSHDTVINLYPNIVDHIDFLIGGSIVNKNFPGDRRALYFNDKDLIDELERNMRHKNLIDRMHGHIDKLMPKKGEDIDNTKHTVSSKLYGHSSRAEAPDNYNGAE